MEFGDNRLRPSFWSKHRQDPNGCWTYIGGTFDWDGRGQVSIRHPNGKKSICPNYRKTCDLVYGPLPKGLTRSHICPGGENKLCANPAHIVYETTAENTKRNRRYDFEYPVHAEGVGEYTRQYNREYGRMRRALNKKNTK
jgi:hypothetical protein